MTRTDAKALRGGEQFILAAIVACRDAVRQLEGLPVEGADHAAARVLAARTNLEMATAHLARPCGRAARALGETVEF